MSATCVSQLTRTSQCDNPISPCSLCQKSQPSSQPEPEQRGNSLRMNNNMRDASSINIHNGGHQASDRASLRSISSEDVSTATAEDTCCGGGKSKNACGSRRKPSKQRLQMMQVRQKILLFELF